MFIFSNISLKGHSTCTNLTDNFSYNTAVMRS